MGALTDFFAPDATVSGQATAKSAPQDDVLADLQTLIGQHQSVLKDLKVGSETYQRTQNNIAEIQRELAKRNVSTPEAASSSLSSFFTEPISQQAEQPAQKTGTNTVDTLLNLRRRVGERALAGIDTALSIPAGIVQSATYASARAAQRTPEEATAISQKLSSGLQPKPLGAAFGVENTEGYQHPLGDLPQMAQSIINKIPVLGWTPEYASEWINKNLGVNVPAADIKNMVL